MASSLSNLFSNFSEGIHEIKCKYKHDDTKCETCGITYEICDCFLEYTNCKDDSTSLFYYCKKVFILMNIWMVGKNSAKHLT